MKALYDFSTYYDDFPDGTYDCIDGIVLDAYFIMAQSNGGFRTWWRRLASGGDDNLDNVHLMRFAGRFARRVRAYADKNQILLIHCQHGDRKHEISQQYLPKDATFQGLFCIMVGRAPGVVREKVLKPLLANACQHRRGRKPKTCCTIDTHYKNIQIELQKIFKIIVIAA